ncbi:MAG: DinB family protein [Chryseolinea sp.]
MPTATSNAVFDLALFSKTIMKSWTLQVSRITDFLATTSDEVLQNETAPGRNTGIYLIGHLIATNDGLFPLLGLGDKMFPDLAKVFVSTPDKSGLEYPSIATLKKYWSDVNEKLTEHLTNMEPEEWLGRHEAVTPEDFEKEPHRNKLNVIISRATHLSYHLGQLIYLREKKA